MYNCFRYEGLLQEVNLILRCEYQAGEDRRSCKPEVCENDYNCLLAFYPLISMLLFELNINRKGTDDFEEINFFLSEGFMKRGMLFTPDGIKKGRRHLPI